MVEPEFDEEARDVFEEPISTELPDNADAPFPFGKFARQALLVTSALLLCWFLYAIAAAQTSVITPVATLILITSLFYSGGPKVVRIGLLGLMAINVLSEIVSTDYLSSNDSSQSTDIPSIILFVCLLLAFSFEACGWLANCSKAVRNKIMSWGLLAVPALIYIAILPLIEQVWVSFSGDEQTIALQDPNWNIWNEAFFRACKFLVFGIFTYMGACIGSFLNVVAYSVPRGETIGLRDSKCPKCDSKISRIDNLPIFSYINLGARCRNCSANIPARYLIVEVIVATIFGSLFLYELISGCTNIPSMRVYHEGILWIILYPKWPAIAVYFYHAFFMSSVLVLSIIELDRQPLRPLFAGILATAFILAAAIFWPIQPVPVSDHLPFTLNLSPLIGQFLKLVIGGMAGVILGLAASLAEKTWQSSLFRFALVLTGIVMGWQALTQILTIYVVVWLAIRFIPIPKMAAARHYPTSVLLAVIMLHHPFWKMISEWWK